MSTRSRIASVVSVVLILSGLPAFCQPASPSVNPNMAAMRRALQRPDYGNQALSVTTETITFQAFNSPRTRTLNLAPDVSVNRLTPVKLADIKPPRWAVAHRMPLMPMGEDLATSTAEAEIEAIYFAPHAPADKKSVQTTARFPTNGSSQSRFGSATVRPRAAGENANAPEVTIWLCASGMYGMEGTSPTLTIDGTRCYLRPAPLARAYEQTPITLADVKPGDAFDFDYRVENRRQVVTVINVRPAGEARPAVRTPPETGATTMQPGAGVNLRRRTRGGRIGTVMPWGNEIVAVSATSITLRNSQYPEGRDFPLSRDLTVTRLKAVKPADIKGRKWATVHRMLKPAGTLDETTSAVLVMRIDIAARPPESRESGIKVLLSARTAAGEIATTWASQDGLVDFSTTPPTFTANGETYRLQIRQNAKIYEQTAIPESDIKPGETADVEFQTINLDYAIKAINIKPADEPRRTIVPRPASAHPLETSLSSGTLVETH